MMNQLVEAAAAASSTAILATRTSDLPPTPTLSPNPTETTDPFNPEYPQSTEHPNRPYGHRGVASTALIISAVSGGLLILTLLSLAVWCILRVRRRRRCHDKLSETEIALKQSIGGRDRDSRHPITRSSSSSEKNDASFDGQSPYQTHASTSSMTMMLDGQESSTGSNRSTLLEASSSSVGGKVTYPPKAMTSPKLSMATRGNRFPKSNAVGGTGSTSPQPSNSQSLLPPPRQKQQQSAHDITYYPHLHQPQPRQPGKQSPVEGVTPLESFYHDMINAPASPSSPPPPEQARRLVLSSKHAVPLPLPFSSSFSASTSSSSSPSKAGPETTKSVATVNTHKKSASGSSPQTAAATVTSPKSTNTALDWPRVSKEHLPPPPPPPSMPPPAIPDTIPNPLTLPDSTIANASTSATPVQGPSSSATVQSPTSPTQVPATPTSAPRKSGRARSATDSSVKSPRNSNSAANRSSNGHSIEAMQQQQPQPQPQQESSKGSHLKLSSPVSVPTPLGQGAILTVPARSGPGHRRTKSNILTLDAVVTPLSTPIPSPSPTSSLSAFPTPPVTTPSSSSFSVPSRATSRPQDRKPSVSSVLQPTKSLGPMTVQVPRPTSWYLKAEEGGGMVAIAGGGSGGGDGRTATLQKNIRETVADSRREGVLSPSYSYL